MLRRKCNPSKSLSWSFELFNDGGGDFFGTLTTEVYLSDDATVGGDRLVATDVLETVIGADTALNRSVSFVIPSTLVDDQYVIIKTDTKDVAVELGGEDNNTTVDDSVIDILSFADLKVDDVRTTPSGSAIFGDNLLVDYDVTNRAQITMLGTWEDEVWLSTDETLDAGDILLSTTVYPNDNGLAAGEQYSVSAEVSLPLDVQLTDGDYYLLVKADNRGGVDNVGASDVIRIEFPPLPDLDVISVSGPSLGQPGESVTFNYRVENIGLATATGQWTDEVYLSLDGEINGAEPLATFTREADLPTGDGYDGTITISLPDLDDGDYQIIVAADVESTVFEGDQLANNVDSAVTPLSIRHVDLVPIWVDTPPTPTRGESVTLSWKTENVGTTTTLGGWSSRIYLSTDDTFSADDRLIGESFFNGVLASGSESSAEQLQLDLPNDLVGNQFFLLVTDEEDGHRELTAGETNNVESATTDILTGPYADFEVLDVVAPTRVIGDPARVTIEYKVRNVGTGTALSPSRSDVVVISSDATFGNNDDRLWARFDRSASLAVGAEETFSERINLPAGETGRFHIFVKADANDEVYENGFESNNVDSPPELIEVLPSPYADLVVTKIDVDEPVFSGKSFDVSWEVLNQGIGITSTTTWVDRVYYSSPSKGIGLTLLGQFDHFGHLDPTQTYNRTATVRLPNGTEGDTFFLYVTTAASGGPFEFIYGDNNTLRSDEFEVSLTPPPDLIVTSIGDLPDVADEGSIIDVSWTVENIGSGFAGGSWIDRIWLTPVSGGSSIYLGDFTYTEGLGANNFYDRKEQVRLPRRQAGVFELSIVTDSRNWLYEHGADGNNTTVAPDPIEISVMPRPDLVVTEIVAPDRVPAGGAITAEFVVTNLGTRETRVPNWVDRVYLSLDDRVSGDDILIAEMTNGSALAIGESYRQVPGTSVKVPERFRGEVHLLATTDFGGHIDEWPNERNNVLNHPVYVEPLPLADLVVSEVGALDQVVIDNNQGNNANGEIVVTTDVTYTVTNLGSGPTNVPRWRETIWLTRDKNRPHPAHGDIKLYEAEFEEQDAGGNPVPLGRNAGRDRTVTVEIPKNLISGTYYITPWVDPYGTVLEDTLAINVNPDDPNEIDNNNYKARPVSIIANRPDLIVTDIVTDAASYQGGEEITVTWTVENDSPTDARPEGWIDRIFLSSHPNPFADGATRFLLGEVEHDEILPGCDTVNSVPVCHSYTESFTTTLTPSAVGEYIVVVTDDKQGGGFNLLGLANLLGSIFGGLFGSLLPGEPDIGVSNSAYFNHVDELDELNNRLAEPVPVRPAPADLKVTNVVVPQENFSGEPTTIQYTITNMGDFPVWSGTQHWTDFIWLSADPTFIRRRASYLGQEIVPHDVQLQPGDSIDVEFDFVLPQGTGHPDDPDSDYYIYIHLNANNELPCGAYPYQCRLVRYDGWPADRGNNDDWVSWFGRWAHEDPSNNIYGQHIPITYREPDLQVTDLVIPTGATSGETIDVTYTVSNLGTRRTRQSSWKDQIFLSHDPSLNAKDLFRADVSHTGALDPGESYTTTTQIRIPDSIEGTFDVLVYTDSTAAIDRRIKSDIGFRLPGVKFQHNDPFPHFDLASYSLRRPTRGQIWEFLNEGNNLATASLPVVLASPPDLQVVELIDVPPRVVQGQRVTFSYTVLNQGGDTAATQPAWDDLIYLSRDQFLDIRSDRYLGLVRHETGLGSLESYTKEVTVRIPNDLITEWYLFVVTDPVRTLAIGEVFERENERNNDLATADPIIIDPPPPTDLEISEIAFEPTSLMVGDEIVITWRGTNVSDEPAEGVWSDTAYLSTDGTWDINDVPLGRVQQDLKLLPGESYTAEFSLNLPSATPDQYRILVRGDIFNQLREDEGEANNLSISPDTLDVTVESLLLDVPYPTTLTPGQERLLQVTVGSGETLQVTSDTERDDIAIELFLRHDDAPTSSKFDASYAGRLVPRQIATVPETEPGEYYILVRRFKDPDDASSPDDEAPVTLLARVLPLQVNNVHTDVGGDSRYVTVTIDGAQFHRGPMPGDQAQVQLIRPGHTPINPVRHEVIDRTRIIATFDFTGAEHGLYDLKVINPGDQVIAPYRFLIERAIEPEVTIGVGGPRIVIAGDAGTYSVALQSLSNLDTPYTFVEVGIPEMGANPFVYNLPYSAFASNLRGAPEHGGLDDISWSSLDSAVNTNGHTIASGYLQDHDADGFTGFSFNIWTYPGLRELHFRNFPELRASLYALYPEHEKAGTLDDGPENLSDIIPGLYELWASGAAVPDLFTIPFIPHQTHLVAAATAMSRDEFIAHSLGESHQLRLAIVNDENASPALLNLAADEALWDDLFLASLEESGLLRPEDEAPPIRTRPQIISTLATLTTGILLGPAQDEIQKYDELTDFFEQIRQWYGHDRDLIAPEDYIARRDAKHLNPVPLLPKLDDFDLGLSRATHFQAFRVYVPWIEFERRGAQLPADFQISGVDLFGGDVRVEQSEPIIGDANAAAPGAQTVLTVDISDEFDARTFLLGEIQLGELTIDLSQAGEMFDGIFDLTSEHGLIIKVSAHVTYDVADSGFGTENAQAMWEITAIDSNTDQPIAVPFEVLGDGSGAVTYSVKPTEGVVPLDLGAFLESEGVVSGLASMVGPFTGETGGFLPESEPLPYTVHFQNDPLASTTVSEVRVVIDIDDDVDERSFRLGDINLGNINIAVPEGRSVFQQDIDFTDTEGFIVRVSAGVDLKSGHASWLLQAIDPLTGTLMTDADRGLLPPNNALGEGAGFVSYTILPYEDIETGTEVSASARVIFDTAPPEDTGIITQIVDGQAPTTTFSFEPVSQGSHNYIVNWNAVDDVQGSGSQTCHGLCLRERR